MEIFTRMAKKIRLQCAIKQATDAKELGENVKELSKLLKRWGNMSRASSFTQEYLLKKRGC